MKLSKFLFVGLLAVCASVFFSACKSDDDATSGFYVDSNPDGLKRGAGSDSASGGQNGTYDLAQNDMPDYGTNGANGANGANGVNGGYDPASMNQGPSAYSNAPVGQDYINGVGPRVSGASLEPVYFMFDQGAVPYSETHKVEAAAAYLQQHPDQGVVVEGNCDERGTLEYNRALGEQRAISVKSALMNMGVQEFRIKTLSWGEEKPAVSGSGEEAWRLNRRAELVPVYLKK